MTHQAVIELTSHLDVRAACQAVGAAQAGYATGDTAKARHVTTSADPAPQAARAAGFERCRGAGDSRCAA
jgi:hypothetical protein